MNLPFAAFGLFGWWEFFRFNGARPADWDSGWYLLCRHLGPETPGDTPPRCSVRRSV